MKHSLLSMGFVLTGCLLPWHAMAATPAECAGTLSFVLENDLFYNADRHYTNGVGFIWISDKNAPAPAWASRLVNAVPWFPRGGTSIHGYAAGQSMFTPSDITVADPPLTERPYAGWLYGTFGMANKSDNQLDLLALTLGVVGPASIAEQTQKLVHKLIGANEPQGWDTQLGNEPGFVVQYQRSWRVVPPEQDHEFKWDVTPSIGGAFGNVFTYANAGAMVRFGKWLPDDFGPPRIQPGLLGSGAFAPPRHFTGYVFAGLEARAVARNIFLDGNTFRDSRSVRREPFVADLQWGGVLEGPKIRVSYTHVIRSKEYRTEDGTDEFGAVSFSFAF